MNEEESLTTNCDRKKILPLKEEFKSLSKKLETLEDLRLEDRKAGVGNGETYQKIKQKAIKWLINGAKKRKNMFKMFMEFHNITEEDLK